MGSTRFDVKATLALGATVLCWASVPVLLREIAVEKYLDAWTANGLRYPLAAVLYWPILFAAHRSGKLDPGLFRRALVPAAVTFCGQILWGLAPYYLEATLIGFLIQSALVWTLLGAMILFADERKLLRSPVFYAGILLAVAGVVALSVTRGALEEETTTTGIVIILACGVFFGLYAVAVRYFMRKDSPLLAFGVVSNYVSIGTVTLMFCFGDLSLIPAMNVKGWSMMSASALLGIALAHVFLYTAIQRIGVSISHGFSLVIPFATLVLAYFALDETLTAIQWAAGTAMVAGGAFLLLSQKRLR